MSGHECGQILALAAWRTRIGDAHDIETRSAFGEAITEMRAFSTVSAARSGHRISGSSTVRVVEAPPATATGVATTVLVGELPIPIPNRPEVATWLVMLTPVSCAPAEVRTDG